ncbi:hypothetical protein TREES_T100008989 [Tupaia chinensis]|uniref:Uncharacterized protein n=1 Tax=Tupaia chinensis TaxID=246437 RepID=L9KS14_TUPCH|nr:hypothetical protein TREES_T100008989 [Tupaia chinensis]
MQLSGSGPSGHSPATGATAICVAHGYHRLASSGRSQDLPCVSVALVHAARVHDDPRIPSNSQTVSERTPCSPPKPAGRQLRLLTTRAKSVRTLSPAASVPWNDDSSGPFHHRSTRARRPVTFAFISGLEGDTLVLSEATLWQWLEQEVSSQVHRPSLRCTETLRQPCMAADLQRPSPVPAVPAEGSGLLPLSGGTGTDLSLKAVSARAWVLSDCRVCMAWLENPMSPQEQALDIRDESPAVRMEAMLTGPAAHAAEPLEQGVLAPSQSETVPRPAV